MPTTTVAYRTTLGLIWGLALWHSWESRGLFVDGSAFLVQIARREWFFDFYAPRLYAMIVGQAPIMTAIFLGVTDLHLLARLLSIGLFALPTALYTLALVRVKDDPVLLAAVIGAIGLVFMTTSFFIVGEYNTAYAIAIVVAVRLVTAERLTVLDGLFLAVISLLAKIISTYAGDVGITILAALSGIADVDAITLSLARLANSGGIAVHTAALGIAIAVAVNTAVKAGMTFSLGGTQAGWIVSAASAAAIVAGGAAFVLFG